MSPIPLDGAPTESVSHAALDRSPSCLSFYDSEPERH